MTMRKKLLPFLMTLATILTVTAAVGITASAKEAPRETIATGAELHIALYDAGAEAMDMGALVAITTVGDTRYLFLPSFADVEALPLLSEAGTVLAGTKTGQSITVSGAWEDTYDLTALFGTMTAGTPYALRVTRPGQFAFTVQVVRSANVPAMCVTSEETISYVNKIKGNTASGTVAVVDPNGKVRYDGEMESLKGRGNSSWSYVTDQKSYNIKLGKKAELIDDAGKAKKWCLLAGDMYKETATWITENPMMAQMTGYQLYQDLNGAYNYGYSPIDLYVNGEYRGTYLLVEAIQINEERVNITETKYSTEGTKLGSGTVCVLSNGDPVELSARWSTDAKIKNGSVSGGFVLEWDNQFGAAADECYFTTTYGNCHLFKDPDMPTKEQVQKIAQYMQDYEDALYADSGYNRQGKYYADYIDLHSLAVRLTNAQLAAQWDSFWKSEYWSIDVDANGDFTKIVAGPSWDFDNDGGHYQTLTAFWMNSPTLTNQTISNISRYLKHGDLVKELDTVLNGMGKTAVKRYAAPGGPIDQWISDYSAAKAASFLRWPNGMNFNADEDTTFSAARFKKGFIRWTECFYSDIWKDAVLRGVTVRYDADNDKLVAVPNSTGTNLTYQWYTVNINTGDLSAVKGAAAKELSNPVPGTVYEVVVTAKGDSILKTNAKYGALKARASLADNRAAASVQISAPVSVQAADKAVRWQKADSGELSLTVNDPSVTPITVCVAAYDAGGRMLSCEPVVLKQGDRAALTPPEAGTTVRLFVLGRDYRPLGNAYELHGGESVLSVSVRAAQ